MHIAGLGVEEIQNVTTSDPLPPTGAPCPGSPGCPGYVDPAVNAAIQAAILAQNQQAAEALALAQQQAAQAQQQQGATPAKTWFPGVSNSAVLVAGGLLVGAILLGRRH